ncbi:MAG: MmgE/PrpD family protein [Cognatishimia sp.]
MQLENTKTVLDGRKYPRGSELVEFIAGAAGRTYPEPVREAARQAFADYIAVAIGAIDDTPTKAVAAMASSWNAEGYATVFTKYQTTPALAALVNGTAAHSQDYDDTHAGGAGHPSGPVWSTAIALGEHLDRSEEEVFSAYITGYEVMAKLCGGGPSGIGRTMQRKGFHPTSIGGRAGAAAAAAVLYKLDKDQIASALGVAATTAGGLIGSFGSHSKPFHSGVAAMDGIQAAQLAKNSFEAAKGLYELEGGIISAFARDEATDIPKTAELGQNWEILRNGFKLFASCRATHPAVETALKARELVNGDYSNIAKVHVKAGRQALVTAGKTEFNTGLDCKFSVAFCVAMALFGYQLLPSDFTNELLENAPLNALAQRVHVEPVSNQTPGEAHIEITLKNGETLNASTIVMRGHPDNPLDWSEIEGKFNSLVVDKIGTEKAARLFELARNIDASGSLVQISKILQPIA